MPIVAAFGTSGVVTLAGIANALSARDVPTARAGVGRLDGDVGAQTINSGSMTFLSKRAQPERAPTSSN